MTSYKVNLYMHCYDCGHNGVKFGYIMTIGKVRGVGCKACGNTREYVKYSDPVIGEFDYWPPNLYTMKLKMEFLEKIR